MTFFQTHKHALLLLGAMAVLAVSFFFSASPSTAVALTVLGAVVIGFAALSDNARLFLLGLLFPFEGLRLFLPIFHDPLLANIFPDGIDQPYVNLWALFLLCLVGYRVARSFIATSSIRLPRPLLLEMVLIVFVALLSTIHAESFFGLSLKYVFFPIAFCLVVFAWLPSALVKKESHLFSLMKGMVVAGGISAFVGAVSLFVIPGTPFPAATPFALFGLAPLGTNHNLLAETLVATVPLALLLAMQDEQRKRWYLALAVFMGGVGLLTFARTAWIAFVVMLVVAWWGTWRDRLRSARRQIVIASLVVLPIVALMAVYSSSSAVQSSTSSRLAITAVSLSLFREQPLIGLGAGTFVSRIALVRDFRDSFGEPIDAHGFLQKLLAEEGVLGVLIVAFFFARLGQLTYLATRDGADRDVLLLRLVALAAGGMVLYELFNTTYWSAKLWLPIGLLLASLTLWGRRRVPSV